MPKPASALAIMLVVSATSTAASAQTVPPVDGEVAGQPRVPDRGAAPDHQSSNWQILAGPALVYAPVFLGAKDYQLLAAPNVQVRYRDRLFIGIDGIGLDILKQDGWRAGPVIGFEGPRKEDGENIFRIAGHATDALRGLGDVDTTIQAGAYVERSWSRLAVRADVRQGIGGDQGLIGKFSLRYTTRVGPPPPGDRPAVMLSFGPRLSVVDGRYNDSYFGIDALQSARSGLPRYKAGAGILSLGVGCIAVIPLTRKVSISLIANYDRLAGDAANSPLVVERGSRNQATGGVGLVYRFGR